MTREDQLARSTEMVPVQGTVDVRISADVLWHCFRQANAWPGWNPCFFRVWNQTLQLNDQLVWGFQPIRPWYLYKLPAIARIVELEEGRRVTWEVTAFPGMYARHTYHFEPVSEGVTRFGSYEKAMGPGFRWFAWFWKPHFNFVKDRSLEGARALEAIYQNHGNLEQRVLPRRSYLVFWLTLLILFALAGWAAWFYSSFVRISAAPLGQDFYLLTGGGGNSVVLRSGRDLLLVDTKFPPAAAWQRDWIARKFRIPVTHLVNTHYHYDHTQGNSLYPEAALYAHRETSKLMWLRDNAHWSAVPGAVPADAGLVGDAPVRLRVGEEEVLFHPEPAHTRGVLCVYFPRANVVATGDLFFHGCYPFFDLGEGGVEIPGLIRALRRLTANYPAARFVPGHGPLATSADLTAYARYLEDLLAAVQAARARHLTEDQAVRTIAPTLKGRGILPSFHSGRLQWATAESSVRDVFRWEVRRSVTATPSLLPAKEIR